MGRIESYFWHDGLNSFVWDASSLQNQTNRKSDREQSVKKNLRERWFKTKNAKIPRYLFDKYWCILIWSEQSESHQYATFHSSLALFSTSVVGVFTSSLNSSESLPEIVKKTRNGRGWSRLGKREAQWRFQGRQETLTFYSEDPAFAKLARHELRQSGLHPIHFRGQFLGRQSDLAVAREPNPVLVGRVILQEMKMNLLRTSHF